MDDELKSLAKDLLIALQGLKNESQKSIEANIMDIESGGNLILRKIDVDILTISGAKSEKDLIIEDIGTRSDQSGG